MKPRFTLQRMFLIITLAGVFLWFLLPVTAINRRALKRVKPGMTVREAEVSVGLPIGSYDGIGSARSNAPYRAPSWLGLNGELVLIVDRNDRVERAEFYRADVSWHLTDYLWERFTWLQVVKTSLPQRIVWYLASALVGTLVIAELFIPANSRNSAAWLGLAGLLLGPILSVAIFLDGVYGKPDMTYEALLGPFIAALIGIIVGFTRLVLVRRSHTTMIDGCQSTERNQPKLMQIGR